MPQKVLGVFADSAGPSDARKQQDIRELPEKKHLIPFTGFLWIVSGQDQFTHE